MIWTFGAALFILGAAALFFGLRRSRRGSDPYCAKCHHNLNGLKDAARCPECGADVSRPRAVKRGAPFRRARWAAVGALLLLVSLTAFIAGGYFRTDPATVMKWLPDWAVAMQAKDDGEYAAEARTEMMNRLNAGDLGQGTIDRLINHALARQADRTATWDTYWGDVVEIAHGSGMVTPDLWRTYLTQGAHVPIRARKRIRPGDRLPVELRTEFRFGSLTGEARFLITAPVPADWNPDMNRWPGWIGTSVPSGGLMTTSVPCALTEPGLQDVRIGVMFALIDAATQQPMVDGFYTITAPIELASDDHLRSINEDVLPDTIRATLTVRNIRIGRYQGPRGDAFIDGMVSQARDAGPMQWPLALRIFARIDGTEHDVGFMAAPIGTANHGWGIWQAADLPDTIERIDIILRADPHVARGTLDIFEYWDGEIVFEDVEFVDQRREK